MGPAWLPALGRTGAGAGAGAGQGHTWHRQAGGQQGQGRGTRLVGAGVNDVAELLDQLEPVALQGVVRLRVRVGAGGWGGWVLSEAQALSASAC
jgi:hypothetical protein